MRLRFSQILPDDARRFVTNILSRLQRRAVAVVVVHPPAALYMNARPQPRTRSVSSGIPAYSSSGRRLRNYSLEAIEQILTLERPHVVVKRNKRTGRITSAQFLPLPQNSTAVEGKEPIRKTAHMGQAYSHNERIYDTGLKTWKFSKVLVPREMRLDPGVTPDEIERWVQSVFRQVQLSCFVPADPPEPEPEPPTPKVVCISTGRGFRPAVSNDSDERLAA